jgi:tyrosine-protein kinase Etk/Wzc
VHTTAKEKMMSYSEPEGLTYKVIKAKLRQNWYWFFAFSLSCLFIAFAYYKIASPYYEISTTILVKSDSKTSDLNNIFRELNTGKNNPVIQDQVGVLKSYNLNFRTLQYFNWRHSWFKRNLFVNKDLYGQEPFDVVQTPDALQTENVPVKIVSLSGEELEVSCDEKIKVKGKEITINFSQKLKLGEVLKNEFFQFSLHLKPDQPVQAGEVYYLVFNNINHLALRYKEKLEVKPLDVLANSNLISVKLVTSNLQRDVDYLNQLGKIYIQFGLDEKNRVANNTIKFIDDQISGVNVNLQQAGNQFSSFRAQNRTVDLGKEATAVVDRLKLIENDRAALLLKLDYYNNLKYYLDNRSVNDDLVAPSIVGVTDDALNANVLRLNQLYTRREMLSYTAQEQNPVLISVNNEISLTQKSLRENVDNLIANTQVELNSMEERLRTINVELSRLPKTEQDLIGIKRNFDLNNELYTFLLQRRAEAEIAKASNNPDAQILDPTDIGIAKLLGPILVINLFIGLFGGLFIALAFVVFKELVSEVLTSVDDINQRLNVAVIGSITTNRYKTEIPVNQYPRSSLTESFRGLRVNLEYLLSSTGGKVLGVHSYISGEGKSFVAVNAAIILAMSNKKVLLIDSDLRKPRIHKMLNKDNEVGLSTYLSGNAKADEVIKTTDINNLSLVTSGVSSIASSELLNNGMIRNFVEAVREKFDYIIIDNSPFGVVYDPLVTGASADYNLVLVRLNYSRKEGLDSINRIGQEGILKNVMVAINGIKNNPGYGYYTDDKKSAPENVS